MAARKKDSFLDTLSNAEGGFPAAWRAEKEGDMLVGTITGFDQVTGDYGTQTVCTVLDEDTDEEVALYISSTVLKSQFQRLDPKVGERLGVKYVGLVDSKVRGRQPYKNYIVRVDRAVEEQKSFRAVSGTEDTPAPWDAPEAVEEVAPAKPTASIEDPEDDLPF